MQNKFLKIGWMFMVLLGIYRVFSNIMLVAMDYGTVTSGVNLAASGRAITGIALISYRKAETWSWWTLLVVGIMPLAACSILHGLDPITIGGWILFILAIAIPAAFLLEDQIF